MASVLELMHRRAFLRSAALATAGAALPWRANAATGQIAIQPIDESSALVTGAGENVFATLGGDGLILADVGASENATEMLDALAKHFGERRVDAAFNTHWHYPNTGGNAAAKAAGARIFAHENTRLWLAGDFVVPWQDRRYKPLPREMQPTETFFGVNAETKTATLGGREVTYVYRPRAHTDGDIFVHFPDVDVIAAGGLVSVGSYPILDYATGGWIGEMTDAAEAILEVAGPDTKIIPGVGPIVGRDHVAKQFEMLTTVRDRVYDLLRKGRGAEEMLQAGVTEEFDAEWGDPTLFVTNIYPGLHSHHYEVGGIY